MRKARGGGATCDTAYGGVSPIHLDQDFIILRISRLKACKLRFNTLTY